MFLHLGGDVVVAKKDVVMILDARTKKSPYVKEFLEIAKDEGFIKVIAEKEQEKSLIITTKKIFLSPISCTTLKKRSDNVLNTVDKEEDDRG